MSPFAGTPDQGPRETMKKGVVAKVNGEAPDKMWIPSKGNLFKKPQSALDGYAKWVVQLWNKILPCEGLRYRITESRRINKECHREDIDPSWIITEHMNCDSLWSMG
ncbi:hypothetical protein B9Z19DRAFT_1069561 [Tuber borchii]|uniref:Uncharacterized protein n=1 Tax=Tuber borchii TaxID=42251 RepID=A0A2T6ZB60_TUBBO|nr:hypothetical protein B9Z19DRAFT_1069561 [Tuber borchii]